MKVTCKSHKQNRGSYLLIGFCCSSACVPLVKKNREKKWRGKVDVHLTNNGDIKVSAGVAPSHGHVIKMPSDSPHWRWCEQDRLEEDTKGHAGGWNVSLGHAATRFFIPHIWECGFQRKWMFGWMTATFTERKLAEHSLLFSSNTLLHIHQKPCGYATDAHQSKLAWLWVPKTSWMVPAVS